jgi:hypothetical protein
LSYILIVHVPTYAFTGRFMVGTGAPHSIKLELQ